MALWQTPHGVTFLDTPMSSNSCSFQYKQPFATSYTQLLAPHLLHFSYFHVIISLFIAANDFQVRITQGQLAHLTKYARTCSGVLCHSPQHTGFHFHATSCTHNPLLPFSLPMRSYQDHSLCFHSQNFLLQKQSFGYVYHWQHLAHLLQGALIMHLQQDGLTTLLAILLIAVHD